MEKVQLTMPQYWQMLSSLAGRLAARISPAKPTSPKQTVSSRTGRPVADEARAAVDDLTPDEEQAKLRFRIGVALRDAGDLAGDGLFEIRQEYPDTNQSVRVPYGEVTLDAARAGVDGDDGVLVIVLAGEHHPELEVLDAPFEIGDGGDDEADRVAEQLQRTNGEHRRPCVDGEGLSRAFPDAELIVVDEPMVGLDPRSSRILKDLLRTFAANGGTVFLDEVGETSAAMQVKLLRALQEGEIRRVGESKARQLDVRILAATARDLESDVQEGEFRSDLYYRINVVRIHLPPLRHRVDDVPVLLQHFLGLYNESLGLEIEGFEPEAIKALSSYSWPGNIRELENVVERAMVLADGERIDVDDLPEGIRDPKTSVKAAGGNLSSDELSVKKRTFELEKHLIGRALEVTGGNRTKAADLLDLSYRALLYKIRDYGLE